jgi:hypothetical protein
MSWHRWITEFGFLTLPLAGWADVPTPPGARGNVDTRAVYDILTAAGWQTGLDGNALAAADMVMKRIASGLTAAAGPEGQV